MQRQARLAQRSPRRTGLHQLGHHQLHGRVVGDQAGQAAVDDPVQQPAVPAVQARAGGVQARHVGLAIHGQQRVGKAGVDADHVALFHRDAVGVQDAHQLLVAHGLARAAQVVLQVDQHAAALRAVLGQALDAQRGGLGVAVASMRLAAGLGGGIFHAGADLLARAEAVVEHRLGHAVAIGVEAAAHMGQAVPLGGVLQTEQHHVVVDHIGQIRVFRLIGPAEALLAGTLSVADHGVALRRDAARVHGPAARHVQRQAQHEAAAFAHLGHALQHLGRRHQVHAAALVVGAELAPVAAFGCVLPASGHGRHSGVSRSARPAHCARRPRPSSRRHPPSRHRCAG